MINSAADGAIEFSISPHKLLRRDARVVTAEAEGVVDDGVHLHFARNVGHIIQITFRIGILKIDGRRDDPVLDCKGAGGHFDRARRAEHVAGRALGGADGNFFRVVAENGLDGLRFADVALRRGCAVGVDVIDVPDGQTAAAQGHFHAARRALAIG